ncbi:MAG: D-2-hydroxyacid dehydrogenase, partial [Gemmatimonadota bacterium]
TRIYCSYDDEAMDDSSSNEAKLGFDALKGEWQISLPVAEEDLAWAEVYLGFRRPTPAAWGGVRWVHSTGAGVDRFLFRADFPDELLLTRSPEDFGPQIGEYCLARMLAVTQQLRLFDAAQARRTWSALEPESLAGSRAVIVGTGLVGRGIATVVSRQGVVVDGVSRGGAACSPFARVHPVSALAQALTGARWLVLAAPLTEASYHLVDRALLSGARGLHLINVGRGALVDEAVIPEALDQGWLSGASLDVFETEPLPPDSPLWAHPQVVFSPHCSGVTDPSAASAGFLECLAEVEAGRLPRWAVDRERTY